MSVRSHPKKDDGYATLEAERDLSDATAIIQTLMFHRDFVIVDNRMPTDVSHWPAFAFFFHEYGRRVGMVPRSSLKEGKYSQMVEKRTKTTQ